MEFFNEFKGIKKSGSKLPHWQQGEVPLFITYRLNDSLPKLVVEKWQRDRAIWLKDKTDPWDDETKQEYQRRFVMKLEDVLDNCHGSCVLERPDVRNLAIDSLHFFDGKRITLDCYVVMPNHIHTIFSVKAGHNLDKIMKSIKGVSARKINKLIGSSGNLWQANFWDRLIRSPNHLAWTRDYIVKNPAKLPDHCFSLWTK